MRRVVRTPEVDADGALSVHHAPPPPTVPRAVAPTSSTRGQRVILAHETAYIYEVVAVTDPYRVGEDRRPVVDVVDEGTWLRHTMLDHPLTGVQAYPIEDVWLE